MKLKVLVDNHTYIDRYFFGEPAVSYYLEDGDTKLLFDTGYSDLFIRNALQLDVDLKAVSKIVLSHGHNDHTGGLAYLKDSGVFNLKQLKLIAHPDTFDQKVLEDTDIGCPISKTQLEKWVKIEYATRPTKLSPNLTYLGEIPRVFDFENDGAIGQCACNLHTFKPDHLLDDTAVVYTTPQGLYIITGCSHSGICNIIEYAKKVCGSDTILGIIGGFHLFELSPRLDHTLAYFKQNQIKSLYPCHCVSFKVKAAIHQVIPIEEVGVGLELEW